MTESLDKKGVTRRQFLFGGGAVLAGVAVNEVVKSFIANDTVNFTHHGGQSSLRSLVSTMPPSAGYLVHDSSKCAFCLTCAMVCSLAHEGKENISLSRIQIGANAFGRYPNDLVMNVCRQCTTPVCVERCPTGACHIDTNNGNVRVIDQSKCIGCQACIEACPQQPHRTIWNPETKKSTKCDLCLNTPYWGEKGGPNGKQACVELCPMNAIKFVSKVPSQQGDEGYEVNLRSQNYEGLVTKVNTTVWWK